MKTRHTSKFLEFSYHQRRRPSSPAAAKKHELHLWVNELLSQRSICQLEQSDHEVLYPTHNCHQIPSHKHTSTIKKHGLQVLLLLLTTSFDFFCLFQYFDILIKYEVNKNCNLTCACDCQHYLHTMKSIH